MKQRPISHLRRILIFAHSNIGDVCYDLLAVAALRERIPHANIIVVTSPQAASLAEVVDGVSEVLVFDKHRTHKGLSGYVLFLRQLRRQRFDMAVVLRNSWVPYWAGIPWMIRRRKTDQSGDRHIARQTLDALKPLGNVPAQPRLSFAFSREDTAFAEKVLSGLPGALRIGIMPLANWKLKCWPVEYWNEVIAQMRRRWQAVPVIFGRSDSTSGWERNFITRLDRDAVHLIDRCSLRQSLAVLQRMQVLISLDTSLLHVASCVRIPCIGLYGPSGRDVFYPLYHRDYMIVSPYENPCVPCYRHTPVGPCGVRGEPAECMRRITPEQVLRMLDRLLGECGLLRE